MPAAKSEDLRWLMVYKRVVEEAPQKAIAAHCRERCQSRERDFNKPKKIHPRLRASGSSPCVWRVTAADASRAAARASDTALIPVRTGPCASGQTDPRTASRWSPPAPHYTCRC